MCWLSTSAKLAALSQIWSLISYRVAAAAAAAAAAATAAATAATTAATACADVTPNYRSRHAETVLLEHFKACAIGVAARLKQLSNGSFRLQSFTAEQLRKPCCSEWRLQVVYKFGS